MHDGIWVYEISNEFFGFSMHFLRNSFWKEESFCVEIISGRCTKQIIQSRPLMVGKPNFYEDYYSFLNLYSSFKILKFQRFRFRLLWIGGKPLLEISGHYLIKLAPPLLPKKLGVQNSVWWHEIGPIFCIISHLCIRSILKVYIPYHRGGIEQKRQFSVHT